MKALPQLIDVASDQQSAGRTLNIEVNREAASGSASILIWSIPSTMFSASATWPGSYRP